jgi:protein-L-isoaspartate O-methyltransferase
MMDPNPQDMLALEESWANKVHGGVFYSKSDEKFTLRAMLEQILGERKFERGLDVGPGAGYISEPLASRTKQLTMIEKQPEYAEILRTKFGNAHIIIGSVDAIDFRQQYDCILFSHVLYYQPEDTWIATTKRLLDALADGGELLVILNSDSGDWWRILSHYWESLRDKIPFYYVPMSKFKRELMQLGRTHSHPYRFQVFIEPGDSWVHFVGKQVLEISDEEVLKHADEFRELASNFKQVDNHIVLDMRAEIVRITRNK